jgi:hypothetical protein
MKRVLTGTCLAAAFAVGLAAQTPQTPQTPPSTPSTPQTPPSASYPSASQDRDSAKTVTVTGCLKAGDAADSYTLSDLKWGSKSTGAVGTSGSTSAPAEIGSATTLKIAPGSTKLSEHVGHQVEITGMVDKGSSSSSSASTSPTDPAAGRPSATASASASTTPTFQAKSVKMVSATCSM